MAGSSPSTQTPAALSSAELKKAMAALEAGDIAGAAAIVDALQRRVQGDPRIYMVAMRIAEAAGKPAEALQAARLAVKTAPHLGAARMDLAMCLARQNQFDEALDEAARAVRLAADDINVVDGAIQVAHRAGALAIAVELLPRAIGLAGPGNTEYRRLLAGDLATLGRADEALQLLDQLLDQDPDDRRIRESRARVRQSAGNTADAAADWRVLCDRFPEDAAYRFQRAVADGETVRTQPAAVAEALFDGIAQVYERRAVSESRYHLPKAIAEWILAAYPERRLNVLDLGCGTGLLGGCLGQIDGHLIGVDISAGMIDVAGRRGLYSRFHRVDLRDALRDTPDGLYEVVAAIEVFPYVGALDGLLSDALRIVKPGGQLIFSCERGGDGESDLVLRSSGRFAHRRQDVEALCRDAGADAVEAHDCTRRVEGGRPVAGFWIVAHKA